MPIFRFTPYGIRLLDPPWNALESRGRNNIIWGINSISEIYCGAAISSNNVVRDTEVDFEIFDAYANSNLGVSQIHSSNTYTYFKHNCLRVSKGMTLPYRREFALEKDNCEHTVSVNKLMDSLDDKWTAVGPKRSNDLNIVYNDKTITNCEHKPVINLLTNPADSENEPKLALSISIATFRKVSKLDLPGVISQAAEFEKWYQRHLDLH
jgi:hypothetical protein